MKLGIYILTTLKNKMEQFLKIHDQENDESSPFRKIKDICKDKSEVENNHQFKARNRIVNEERITKQKQKKNSIVR